MSYVSHLACSVCGNRVSSGSKVNVCANDGRPLQIFYDLDRLASEKGPDGWWNPARPNMWRFGGLLPLDFDDPADCPHIITLGEGHTPCRPYPHPLAESFAFQLEIKDEGKPYDGFGSNPTLSFKDRGMAMTVSMARSLGLTRLAVPTQGNAGDSLARYAVSARIDAVIVMSPDTDLPILGNAAALAKLYPDHVSLELVPGTIIDCGRRVREHYVPQGYFSVATFQDPGWRTEGKKTLGLELAEPAGARLSARKWQLPDVIIYPTGGGTGIVGMAKAFDELEQLGLIGSHRPRMVSVQSEASTPIARAWASGAVDIEPRPPGRTIATGLNVAQNIGHVNVLEILRGSAGCAITVSDEEIVGTIRAEWRERRFAWSPEGAATLAALPQVIERGLIERHDRVVLVNTAAAEKYLPTIRHLLDGGL